MAELDFPAGEVANCLELAYMKLGDHPDLAKRAIQQQVSDDYSEAFTIKKQVEDTHSKLEVEMHSARKQADLAEAAAKDSAEEWTPAAAVLTGAALGTPVSLVAGAAYAAGKLIYNFMSNKKNKESKDDLAKFKAFEKSYINASDEVDRERERLEKHRMETIDRKKEAIDNVRKMREMCSQHVSAGDPQCLVVVQENLGKVDAILTRIIEFWSSMAAVAQDIIENGKTLPRILIGLDESFIEEAPEEMKAELNGMVQNCILDVEKGWNLVGGICYVYIRDNDIRLLRDYEFLSRPIDQMAQADRRTRESKLLMLMEQEVEKAYATEAAREEAEEEDMCI
ncbi:hypothetical protein MAR_028987 [Mya arenaria]|uniref:Uncharacterized protein n=1 Tax=Mya arenaria TaxID=6604 RepID=A0ABY7DF72_MYAAR|nr:hypothetical protein MAR_028987 [Mya arenaria]